jgi:hypothetical protein
MYYYQLDEKGMLRPIHCTLLARGRTRSLVILHGRAFEKTCLYLENKYLYAEEHEEEVQ